MSNESGIAEGQRAESREQRGGKLRAAKVATRYWVHILEVSIVLIVFLSLSCAINPVTGEKEFMLVNDC